MESGDNSEHIDILFLPIRSFLIQFLDFSLSCGFEYNTSIYVGFFIGPMGF